MIGLILLFLINIEQSNKLQVIKSVEFHLVFPCKLVFFCNHFSTIISSQLLRDDFLTFYLYLQTLMLPHKFEIYQHLFISFIYIDLNSFLKCYNLFSKICYKTYQGAFSQMNFLIGQSVDEGLLYLTSFQIFARILSNCILFFLSNSMKTSSSLFFCKNSTNQAVGFENTIGFCVVIKFQYKIVVNQYLSNLDSIFISMFDLRFLIVLTQYHFQIKQLHKLIKLTSQTQFIMAFVFETERKVNQISKLVNPTGPGQYFKQQNQTSPSHAVAPFQSTSKRKTLFQIKDSIKPGPGQYQVRTNIIQPNIKTVSNSQSIIVKINSTGTSQFKSARQRFGNDQTYVPGPGNYKLQDAFSKKRSSSPNSLNKSLNIQKKLKQLTKSLKNYPAIPQRTRGLTDMKKQEEPADQQKRGPACYDPKKKFSLNSTGTVWGKDKTRRFSADKFNQVGPGKYHIDLSNVKQQQKTNQPSGHFKSATVRTFFDSLYYKTNKNQTARQRDGQNFKTKDPSPGQYQVNKSSFNVKEKPFSFQFFGSTVQRFPQDDVPFQKTKSKTFYNIGSQIGRNRSFNRGKHGFNSQSQRQTEFLSVKTKQKVPGPGHYKQKIVVQKKLKGNNVQKFGSTTQRPFYKKPEFDQIGPGKYGGNQNQQELIKSKFGQVKQISANFRSTTDRNCFGAVKNDVPLAQYDVSQYDISKKVEKQKNFLQNLKKIQVQKAPFESTHTRFPHYQKKQKSQKKSVADFNKQHQLKIKQETQKARNQIIQFNRTQLKQKQANGYFNKEDRFKDQRKGGPGVGAYRVYTGFQMKSYNVKYQKDKK